MPSNDVVIIGAGPAGIAAAIQLKRSGFNPVVFEKKIIGGLLNNANLVENYPGFPGGIDGRNLVILFKEQLESFGIKINYERVISLDYEDELFKVQTESGETESEMAIIASGTQPKRVADIKIADKIKNMIYYEITDLLDISEKKVTIIGAGDAAFDYALNLSRKNNVRILNRESNIKCLPLLYDRVKDEKRKNAIKYLSKFHVLEINESSTNQLLLKCRNKSEDVDIISDYVIFAIGREESFGFMSENIEKIKEELEKEGLLYFIGDVKNRIYRQTAIAVGDGILAAMRIESRKR